MADVIGELQRIADRLGTVLDRPVAIDDMQIRQYVYTYHPSGNDPAREQAILHRRASPEILRWVSEHRSAHRRGAFVLPANAEIGMTFPRWGAVARIEGRPVAYVWVQTDDARLTKAEQQEIVAAAERVADVVRRQRRVDDLRSLSEQESLIQLLSEDATVRARALRHLADSGVFKHSWPVTAIVLLPLPRKMSPLTEEERSRTAAVLGSVRQTLPLGHTLSLVRQDHALLVVARSAEILPSDKAKDRELAEIARQELEAAMSEVGQFAVWAGVGTVSPTIADVLTSYQEALQSARVAAGFTTMGKTVFHGDLGIYGRIFDLVSSGAAEVLHPGIRLLIEREQAGDQLAETLEVFLDLAGDATRSAQVLHLHRASLYGRIRRIEELTQLDLGNGQDRLVAHLEIKMARLQHLRQADTSMLGGSAAAGG